MTAEKLPPDGIGILPPDVPWEVTDRKLTFGYVDPTGEWVPGILENIRNIRKDADTLAHQQSLELRWLLRVIFGIAIIRFLGVESVANLVHMFTSLGH